MRHLVTILAFIFPTDVLAAEFDPYPVANISVEEWTDYHNLVKTEFSETARPYPDHHLVVYPDEKERISYIFTTEGHPAHPAWVTRRVVMESGDIYMDQIGYFAGEEEAFAILFRQYQEMNDKIIEEYRLLKDDDK